MSDMKHRHVTLHRVAVLVRSLLIVGGCVAGEVFVETVSLPLLPNII